MYRESSGWLILQKENAMYFDALIRFQGKQLPHYHLTSISIGGLILKSKIFPLRADPILKGLCPEKQIGSREICSLLKHVANIVEVNLYNIFFRFDSKIFFFADER